MKSLGTCILPLVNPKTPQKYMVNFVVVKEELTPQCSWEDETYRSQLQQVWKCHWSGWRQEWHPTRFFWCVQWTYWHFAWLFATDLKTWCRTNLLPTQKTTHFNWDKVKEELERLVETRVLAYVDEPIDWVNQIELAKDGSLQICRDPRSLNLALKREH